MKTIEEMAHEYAMLHMMNPRYMDVDDREIIGWAFDYAEAMQAEAEKRKATPNADPMRKVREAEWQPDWSQAPEWAKYWMIASNGAADWLSDHPSGDPLRVKVCHAPSFNYQGDWKDSLRKRP